MSLNEVWDAAAGSPFYPAVSKERQFLVGFSLLVTGKQNFEILRYEHQAHECNVSFLAYQLFRSQSILKEPSSCWYSSLVSIWVRFLVIPLLVFN